MLICKVCPNYSSLVIEECYRSHSSSHFLRATFLRDTETQWLFLKEKTCCKECIISEDICKSTWGRTVADAMRALDVPQLLVANRPLVELMLLWATIATVGKPWLYMAVGAWLLYKCVTQRAFLCRTIQTLPRDFKCVPLFSQPQLLAHKTHASRVRSRHKWSATFDYKQQITHFRAEIFLQSFSRGNVCL